MSHQFPHILNAHCTWTKKFHSKSGTPIAHGRKYFIICGYMESIPQQPKNTKFRPIEKSNNHKSFRDSGNVFMRFLGLHL